MAEPRLLPLLEFQYREGLLVSLNSVPPTQVAELDEQM